MMTSLFIFFSVSTYMKVRFFKNSAWKTSPVSSASFMLIYSYTYILLYSYKSSYYSLGGRHTYTHACAHMHVCMHMHTCMCTHAYIHTCIHTCTYIYQLYKKAISNAAATGPVCIDHNTSKALLPVLIHADMWLSLQK